MIEANDPAAPSDDPLERFLVLVARYFDGDLDGAEMTELNALLGADAECRRLFAEYASHGCLIREALDSERQRPKPPSTESTVPAAARTGVRRRGVLMAAAGLLTVAAALAIIFWPPTAPVEVPVAAVAVVEPGGGDVRVISSDGQVRVVAKRTDLRAGDTVRGAAAIIYSDGTRLSLVGDTAVTCSGRTGKSIVLHHGTVGASVHPQPEGNPMVLTTSAVRVEVIGTEFYCRSAPDRTEVSVTKGSVRVVRTSDGRTVDVPERKRVLVETRADFAVEDIPRLLDTWDLDFEQGLPADMHRGRFVTENLPRGSKGGVAAVRSTRKDTEGYFEIASPERWEQGLFTFHPDSHLHITYTVAERKWVNVFVIARSAGPNGAHLGNYLFNEAEFIARAGTWRTVTIPLAKLRRAGFNRDAGPGSDEVPYLFIVSSDRDRGLVIDRVWVTRGGPGKVEYKDIE